METIYTRIQTRARQIVSRFPTPDFYKKEADAIASSRKLMEKSRHISDLKAIVIEHLEDDFGHGLQHAVKVSLEAGALVLIEEQQMPLSRQTITRHVLLVQCAGLLHDIRRKKKNHAIKGAEFTKKLLQDFPLSSSEVANICLAIQNHEAFKNKIEIDSAEGKLISDCLYDADKFRWGPDNFTDTLWEMVSFLNPPLETFITHYPKGMKGLERIKQTFRSHAGKRYGPNFIDIGLAIGEKLYRVIQKEFDPFK
ncbi:MAG: HD domain-containing protein [Desulfobacterales bacterium]|nr:HD domain-containing protein [Desulfobacterales bacterium]MDX2510606.1 HD domain-containing protein [Desulfobacterales bacterium]